MARGLSQDRAQRIWDGAYAAAFTHYRMACGLAPEEAIGRASVLASEAVTALRERQSLERGGKRR